MLVERSVLDFLGRARSRAHTVASIGTACAFLLETSPVSLESVLGPTVALVHGYARAHAKGLGWILGAPDSTGWGLTTREVLARDALAWGDMWSTASTLAVSRRLPRPLSAPASGPARQLGSAQRGVEYGVTLEQMLNVASIAGIGVDTFWSRSSAGMPSLGRLVTMDTVLTREYDHDVLAELEVLHVGVVPRSVDGRDLLRRVQAARPELPSEPHVEATSAVRVTDQMDLSVFAAQVLGSAEAWRILVEYNGLRYPYVSADPVDQLGDSLAVLLLAAPVASGSSTMMLLDAAALHVDERVVVRYGAIVQVFTVAAVAGSIVTLAEAATADFPITATLSLHAALVNLQGRVLRPGDVLLVPSSDSTLSRAMLLQSQRSPLDMDRVYGRDIRVTDQGLLVDDRQDLGRSTGRDNVIQALRHRVRTPRGSLRHHPEYGTVLDAMLGLSNTEFQTFFAMVTTKQSLRRDPRVAKLSGISARIDGDVLSLNLTVETKHQEQFPLLLTTRVA